MFEIALGQLNAQILKAIFSFVKTPGAERGRAGVPLLAVRMQDAGDHFDQSDRQRKIDNEVYCCPPRAFCKSHIINDNKNDDTYRFDTNDFFGIRYRYFIIAIINIKYDY